MKGKGIIKGWQFPKVGWLFYSGIVSLGIVAIVLILILAKATEANVQPTLPQITPPAIEYRELSRNTESYFGQSFCWTGSVQVCDESRGESVVFVTQRLGLYQDGILLRYAPRLLRGDRISFCGTVTARLNDYYRGQAYVLPVVVATRVWVEGGEDAK